jgi:hypothetical protein
MVQGLSIMFQKVNMIVNGLHIACSDQPYEENSKRTLVVQPCYTKFAGHTVFAVNFKIVFKQLEMFFEKPKRILSRTNPITKSSLSFCTTVIFWEIRRDLFNLFFRFKYLMISCFSYYLWAQILRIWRRIFKNWKRFFSRTGSSPKTSPIFVTTIVIQEI